MKHSHYKKPVAGLQFVDVYRVLALFGVTDPCLQHAVKKLLVAGGRGAKAIGQDVQEAIDTLQRWQEMRVEDSPIKNGYIDPLPVKYPSCEPASLIDDESPRMQAIGQNGPSGEHYDELLELAEVAILNGGAPLKEPHQPRHRCLACAGGHSTHECGAGL